MQCLTAFIIRKEYNVIVILLFAICRYKMAYSSNYSWIVDPVIENNYQLFMIERLILMGAKTVIQTFKSEDTDLSLSDDPKKNTGGWMKVVSTEGC